MEGFAPGPAIAAPRRDAAAAALPGGRVLVAGGTDGNGITLCGCSLATTEIYDPATGAFGPGPDLAAPRKHHAAAALPDGRALVAGGLGLGTATATTEIYDPATGAFGPGPDLAASRKHHAAAALPDGRVLVAGGLGLGITLATTEIYDPATGAFGPGLDLAVPRSDAAAAALPDGRVLVAGGDRWQRRHPRHH